ncbi:hypothetical protein ACFLQL_02990, partial [Verrucomicrobiota bacterium]
KQKLIKEFYKRNKNKKGLLSWCKICVNRQNKNWAKDNYKLDKFYKDKWDAKNKAYYKKYNRKLYSTVKGKLNCNMSGSIRKALKGNKVGRHWENLVGYTIAELKQHLEAKFKSGMTWNNYGVYGWHIDHIIPKDFFKFTSEKDVEFQYCWSLNNLQPLWAKDNLKKQNKI